MYLQECGARHKSTRPYVPRQTVRQSITFHKGQNSLCRHSADTTVLIALLRAIPDKIGFLKPEHLSGTEALETRHMLKYTKRGAG